MKLRAAPGSAAVALVLEDNGFHQAFNGGVDMEDALARRHCASRRNCIGSPCSTCRMPCSSPTITVSSFICQDTDSIFGYGPDQRSDDGADLAAAGQRAGRPGAALATSGEIRNIEHKCCHQVEERSRRCSCTSDRSRSRAGQLSTPVVISQAQEPNGLLRRNEATDAGTRGSQHGRLDQDIPTGNMTWSPTLGSWRYHRLPPSFASFLERVYISDRDRVSRTMAEAMDGAPCETEFCVR